ncbi:uncharacterized protein LOC128983378 [Macrosteles quadrilineatus]|uniref:uncharacterized protein LOC128983378 n=1 Tax=Macrosteles quadrilineatus TaxID=74068 RepID=UPI0023E1A3F3|nr:uncharacterized protein LOC128983378 [Macrosteles quadrilineatus]
MQNEPSEQPIDEKSETHNWHQYQQTNTFGTSFGIKPVGNFEAQRFDQRPPSLPIRGGIQVLPPVVPPRTVNGSIPNQSSQTNQLNQPNQYNQPSQPNVSNHPVAAPRPKPKPPLPPKRDELTRLTTVRRDPPVQQNQPPVTPPRPINEHHSLDQGIPDVVPTHIKHDDQVDIQCPPEIPPRPEENALKALQQESVNNEFSKSVTEDELDFPNPDLDSSQDQSLESPSSEDGATADIWVRAIDSPVKRKPSGEDTSSKPSSRHASTSDETEEKDVKPQPNKDLPPSGKHRAVLDKSYIKSLKESDDVNAKQKANEVQIPSSVDLSNDNFAQQLTSNQAVPTNVYNDSAKRTPSRVVGSESLPCSRPSSRATSRSSSPASFVSEKQTSTKTGRISAAEALGVVAKPCPRPPTAKRSKQPQEYRRQSLGNLSDSKLSIGYDRSNCSISCTIRGLWNSVGETTEALSEPGREYRRHGQRGSSADGTRTLSRIKFDCGHPTWEGTDTFKGYFGETQSVTGYSTLSRIGRSKTDKYFARSTTPVQSGYSSGDSSSIKEDFLPKKPVKSEKIDAAGRPKSTCNCGQHTNAPVRVDTGKRTFSVEELTTAFARQCSEFSRASPGSGSARGSFGKSPRVTFALAEDMGASGGAISKHSEPERSSGGASKKILRGKSLPNPSTDSDDGVDSRMSGLQHKQFQGGGQALPSQSNRSQPAIGLKQTPKTRVGWSLTACSR